MDVYPKIGPTELSGMTNAGRWYDYTGRAGGTVQTLRKLTRVVLANAGHVAPKE